MEELVLTGIEETVLVARTGTVSARLGDDDTVRLGIARACDPKARPDAAIVLTRHQLDSLAEELRHLVERSRCG